VKRLKIAKVVTGYVKAVEAAPASERVDRVTELTDVELIRIAMG
jgi:hypothetical protein